MKPLFGNALGTLALRRAALVLDIARQRVAMRERGAAARGSFGWAGLAVMAAQLLRGRGWSRVLSLGALAMAAIRRFEAHGAD
jgi:hypothetical protein